LPTELEQASQGRSAQEDRSNPCGRVTPMHLMNPPGHAVRLGLESVFVTHIPVRRCWWSALRCVRLPTERTPSPPDRAEIVTPGPETRGKI